MMMKAIEEVNFTKLGEVMEINSFRLHEVMRSIVRACVCVCVCVTNSVRRKMAALRKGLRGRQTGREAHDTSSMVPHWTLPAGAWMMDSSRPVAGATSACKASCVVTAGTTTWLLSNICRFEMYVPATRTRGSALNPVCGFLFCRARMLPVVGLQVQVEHTLEHFLA
jgi:hypothetical protein